jgi:exopolyphosphatase/guanosine-5'-triphosphate,3'-diphosphate pyrophosphatase
MNDAPNLWPIAVVDIGSNSIRLVIYQSGKDEPLQDIKIPCALGRDLEESGTLNAEAAETAYHALAGFNELCKAFGVGTFFPFATSALRDAKDGAHFASRIKKDFKIHIHVIEGKDEARLSALGVASVLPGVSGIVCDLGGGSMELAKAEKGKIADTLSLPLGVLRLKAHPDDLESFIDGQLALIPDAFRSSETLYAVGGSLRNLVKAFLKTGDKDRKKVEGHLFPMAALTAFAQEIARSEPGKIAKLYGLTDSRAEMMPPVAVLLIKLAEALKIKRMEVSAAGLREGMLHALTMNDLLSKIRTE